MNTYDIADPHLYVENRLLPFGETAQIDAVQTRYGNRRNAIE